MISAAGRWNGKARNSTQQGGVFGNRRVAGGAPARLGIWIEQTEGAKFRLRMMTEIKTSGVNDILYRHHRWLEGFSGGDQRGVCRDANPDLHCAFDQKFPGFLLLEGSQTGGQGAEKHLPRRICRRGLGARDLRPSRLCGVANGRMPFPSLPTPRRCGKGSTPRMRLTSLFCI